MLLRVPHFDAWRYVVIVGCTTGECLQEALQQTTAVGQAAQCFAQKTRLTTWNSYLANDKAERGIAASRGSSWQTLRVRCEAHITSGIHAKAFSFTETDVSAMVHLSLSVNHGSAIARFRRALRSVIQEGLVVRFGCPPPAAQQYRQHILRLFLARGRRALVKRVILQSLPNGDWRNHSAVEFYTRQACPRIVMRS